MRVVGKVGVFATLLCGVLGITTPEGDSNGPLHRAKRYSPYSRAPLAYMNKLSPASAIEEPAEPIALPSVSLYNKRFLYGRDDQSMPPIRSSFRELRVKENNNAEENPISGYPMLRNTRRYPGISIDTTNPEAVAALEDLNQHLAPMTDEDLQTILMLVDGYALSSQGSPSRANGYNGRHRPVLPEETKAPAPDAYYNPNYLTPEDLRRVARMYKLGKRESSLAGQGHFFDLDEPEGERNGVEFLTPKRSKRVGGVKIQHEQETNSRIKKETDPEVEAELDKAFSGPRALPLAAAKTMDNAETTTHQNQKAPTASASSSQIPSPNAKKSIDWSQDFGIDKKSSNKAAAMTTNAMEDAMMKHEKTHEDTSAAPSIKPKAMVASRITEPSKTVGLKESKEHKKLRVREENETENKSDRKWILNEFYKNLAMAGNVKRKRDVSNDDADDLAELEQKMQAAGDEIIWDALKYTGAHKDEPLSPIELAQIKKDIIQKLATAYNLEKIREAIDNFREQLVAIKTNNV